MNLENEKSNKPQKPQLNKTDVRRSFISSFQDKYGHPIKEGDVIREVIFTEKEKYHYGERFDMMGNEKITKIVDSTEKIKGWCLRIIKWSKDCLIAERIADSGNISTSGFDYLNECFMGVNSIQDVEVIGSVHEGWSLKNYA